MEVIPLQKLYEEAEDEDSVIRGLLHWFKNEFFVWVNNAPCDNCSNVKQLVNVFFFFFWLTSLYTIKTQTQSVGVGAPTADDLKYGAHTIELYQCSSCRHITRFPRYK
jgi:peptide-N4-(N-acetyl-beta-glucosaminyl)asparagine amidase